MAPRAAYVRMRVLLAALAVALLVAPAVGAYSSPASLNSLSSWLAQRPVSVHCLNEQESEDDWIISGYGATAYVPGWRDSRGQWHPDKYMVTAHGVCEVLLGVLAGEPLATKDVAWAALVLTHEAGHLRGHRWAENEAKTECWAIRHVGYTLSRMGVGDVRPFVAEAVAIHKTLPLEYQLASCKLPGAVG